MLTTRLDGNDRRHLMRHLLALPREDRHLRFGAAMGDAAIETYVLGIDTSRDALFGVFDTGRDLAGVAHVGFGDGVAELGVSVLPASRRRGIGTALVSRSALHARERGVKLVFMQCLRENQAIARIALALGMRVVARGPDSEAWLPLVGGTSATLPYEAPEGGVRLCDYSLRARAVAAQKVESRSWRTACVDAD